MATTAESSGRDFLPGGRVWRSADLFVLILVIVALVGGVLLRQFNLNATQPATFEGLTFDVPKGSVVHAAGNDFAATANNGLTVRVEKVPAPPESDNSETLVATRAVQLGQQLTLFQSTGTEEVQAAGKNAGLIRYQYVESSSNQFFATGLRIIAGNELLIPNGESFYAVSLEGPSDKRAELDALWPKIQSSVSLGG